MLAFVPSDAAIIGLQAGCVLAPRLAPNVEKLDRFHGRGWAIVPLVSIVGVIYAIRYTSDTATWLTWLALIAVPLLAAAALGWAAHGPRGAIPRIGMALLAVPLFILVDQSEHSLWGEAAGSILDALSCVTLGVLLAAVAPSGWLKLGIVAMSVADVWLVASDLLQNPNATLVTVNPGGHAVVFGTHLPRLQSETFGAVSMGYGDLFVAGVLGALWARRPKVQASAAALTFLLAAAFDLLFFVVGELPATVPVALSLILLEAWDWRRRRRARDRTGSDPPAVSSTGSKRPLVLRVAAGGSRRA